MKENKSKYAILGLISLEPSSGYDIKKTFEKSVASFWNQSYGRIYPMLAQLEAEGLAVKEVREQEARPNRNIYSITPKGRQALAQWLLRPVDSMNLKIEILLKLFFGFQMHTGDSIAQVRHFREQQSRQWQVLKEVEQRMTREHPDHPGLPYWQMCISLGNHFYGAMLTWADETLTRLRAMQANEAGEEAP